MIDDKKARDTVAEMIEAFGHIDMMPPNIQTVCRYALQQLEPSPRTERDAKLLDAIRTLDNAIFATERKQLGIDLSPLAIAELRTMFGPASLTPLGLVKKLLNALWLEVERKGAPVPDEETVPLMAYLARAEPVEVARVPKAIWESLIASGKGCGFSIGGTVASWSPPNYDVIKVEPAETLHAQLSTLLQAWLLRAAPRVRDETQFASFKVTIDCPQGDGPDERTMGLNARIEEEATTDELYGIIPGVSY